MSQAAEPQADAGLGALGREVADDAVRLVRAEVDLAKAQLRDTARRLAVAAVLIVIALVLLLIGVIEALGALPAAFSQRLFGNGWLGWLALGGVIVILAVALGFLGTVAVRRSLSHGKQTVNAIKEDTLWVKGVDEARKQRELSKAALAADLGRLEARVRADLDWRARLRRDGAKLAVGAAAIVLLGAVLVLRARLRSDEPETDEPASLEDVAAELRDIRRSLDKKNGSGGSMAQKALLRALSAAGTAGGTYLARRMVTQRREAAPEEGAEAARAG